MNSLTIEHMFDSVANVEVAVEKLLASECAHDVARLRRVIERLECAWLASVREAERSGEWQADGFVSTAAWLRAQCNLTPAAARSSVRLARTLESLPVTSEAFAAGEISRTHVEVIAGAARPELAHVEAPLVEVARNATPVALRQIVQQVTDALDGDGGAVRANGQFERRAVYLSSTLDGMGALNGTLDPEATEFVANALDTVMEKTRTADDPRSRPQQRADALVELVKVGIFHYAEGPGRNTQPHISLVADVEVLCPTDPAGLVRAIRADADHVGRLSAATIERFACDAAITRVLTKGRCEPLDVGRTTRVISPALWKALVVRDRGCVEPGCDRPPGWSEVHHKIPWSQGGATNLENTELRCWQHHRDEHEGKQRAP